MDASDYDDSHGMLLSQIAPAVLQVPEKALLAAVLEDAIRCVHLTAYVNSHDGSRRCNRLHVGEEARRWMASERARDAFDFVPMCEHLGLEPEAVRKVVASKTVFRPFRTVRPDWRVIPEAKARAARKWGQRRTARERVQRLGRSDQVVA